MECATECWGGELVEGMRNLACFTRTSFSHVDFRFLVSFSFVASSVMSVFDRMRAVCVCVCVYVGVSCSFATDEMLVSSGFCRFPSACFRFFLAFCRFLSIVASLVVEAKGRVSAHNSLLRRFCHRSFAILLWLREFLYDESPRRRGIGGRRRCGS